jgi:hypothetical protein
MMSQHLHHKLAALHQSLLNGKLPRTLHWNEALELIGHLGHVEPRGQDEFAFVIGTQREFFKRPRSPEFATEEVSRLRRFLKTVGAEPTSVKLAQPCRMVVIIDHHAAHIFHDVGSTQLQDEASIKPHDPHHFHRHLVHRKEAHYRGDRVPEEPSFYEEVATALAPANEIVLIGHGTGKSNAAKVLAEYLAAHHPELSRLVKATETADLSSLTEAEAEVIAKRHMIAVV